MGMKIVVVLGLCTLLVYFIGLTRKQWTLCAEYLRLISEARTLLTQYDVRAWPDTLAKWEHGARFVPWPLLQHLARVTRSRLGGMGSLGDVVIVKDGKSEEQANSKLLEIVGALHVVTTKIAR